MFDQTLLEKELSDWHQIIQAHPYNCQAYIRRGMTYFKLAKIAEAIADFDTAEQLDPRLTPYLWQRGLAYYYAGRFSEGAKQFELDLTVNGQDVEETVWRYLCIAQQFGVTEAQTSLLPVRNDSRLVMRQIYELYAGNCSVEDAIAAGQKEGKRGNFYSHLYLGLFYEAAGETAQSQAYIVKALEDYAIEDYMCSLARVHQTVRGWNEVTQKL
ncbi:MAG: tetratricopeptide repeat protein [Actinomycetota bacterium]